MDKLIKSLEWFRCICAVIGFYYAYQPNIPLETAINYLLLWIAMPLAGITGIESVFFGAYSARAKNREMGSAYQTQSGLNNIAVALTAFIVWFWQWGNYAGLAVLSVLYLFFTLSSINHLYEFITQEKKVMIHLARPFLTMMLVVGSLPIILRVLHQTL